MSTITACDVVNIRKILLRELRRDLHGPEHSDEWEKEEVLKDEPAQTYMCGVLFPRGEQPSPAEDDEGNNAGGDDEEDDPGIPASENPLLPSSLGLTFAVLDSVDELTVEYWYARYERAEPEKDKLRGDWHRTPHHGVLLLNLKQKSGREHPQPDTAVDWYSRRVNDNNVVTIFLSNLNVAPEGKEAVSDALCLFQPRLLVKGGGNTAESSIIKSRDEKLLFAENDPDLENYRLLYSDKHVFAVGHGCACEWAPTESNTTKWVATSVLPSYEIPITAAKDIGIDEVPGLSMKLSANTTDPEQTVKALQPLLATYKDWIEEREDEISGLDPSIQARAVVNIAQCKESLSRMTEGLNLLGKNQEAHRAFKFMNEAMLTQRLHSLWAYKRRKKLTDESYESFAASNPTPAWRPFQLAFILMCLPEIENPKLEKRKTVDLLWFPTGGGKTEAYLGLAAFAMALRRLRRNKQRLSGDGGVSVIMRYTLRLLTIQQFQRAAALICACEKIRLSDTKAWGDNRFSIGLWVGMKATPNDIEEAEKALADIRVERENYKGSNPVQLVSCPWCGSRLSYTNYRTDKESKRLIVQCPNKDCDFCGGDGLPVLMVDEEIYLRCPDILISTVDKFAAIPRQTKTSALFGRVTRHCPRHGWLTQGNKDCGNKHQAVNTALPAVTINDFPGFLPPELIIQDELHLISGPLGTLTGLYEFAMDRLCDQSGDGAHFPKIIASTATIRRAQEQVASLFARELKQFPPPGLNASDSFYAFENKDIPGRLYVGVWSPGKSGKTSSIRIISSLLNSVRKIADLFPDCDSEDLAKAADPYGTIVAYFNSLKDLGGNLRLAEDDIPHRLKLLSEDHDIPPLRYTELTSRLKSDEIPLILDRMESPVEQEHGLDLLHATNMISVGVDVDRLGLMVVHGQPKGTSEYIQATSRVGRNVKGPGLVVVKYAWNRPRDTDHYERFTPYHSMIYRYVEATSVTPLSPRALDKGLHAVVYGLVRHLQEGMMPNKEAVSFRCTEETKQIVEFLVERARATNTLSSDEIESFEQSIMSLITGWVNRTHAEQYLRYKPDPFDKLQQDQYRQVLMCDFDRQLERAFVTLTSLREVEKSCRLYYVKENR